MKSKIKLIFLAIVLFSGWYALSQTDYVQQRLDVEVTK